jgi:hypothetical protein
MKGVANWYLGKYYSYIMVYGTTRAPHILPYFVPDRLLMREIAYQTMRTWVTTLLLSSSKKLWPLFPIHIANYTLSNGPHARKEAKSLQDVCLCLGEAKGHDPHELAVGHVRSVGLVIAQFVARSKGYKVEGQIGITGTYPTQCHHNG